MQCLRWFYFAANSLFFLFELSDPVDEMVLCMRNDFLAFHHHFDEVVSHVENSVCAIQQYVLVVVEALKVVDRKLFDFLIYMYVQRILLTVLIVGQECTTNSIVFVNCALLNNHILLASNFVNNRNILFGNGKEEIINITHINHCVIFFFLFLCFVMLFVFLGSFVFFFNFIDFLLL